MFFRIAPRREPVAAARVEAVVELVCVWNQIYLDSCI